jgi:cell division protein DivIC
MKNPFKKLSEKYPWLKYVGNSYVLIALFFVVWMLFLDDYSYLNHRILNKEINELQTNKEYYQNEIKKDESSIKHLNSPDYIEKYAREKYFMKRENEDIFIIEFEDEQQPDEITKAL